MPDCCLYSLFLKRFTTVSPIGIVPEKPLQSAMNVQSLVAIRATRDAGRISKEEGNSLYLRKISDHPRRCDGKVPLGAGEGVNQSQAIGQFDGMLGKYGIKVCMVADGISEMLTN